MTSSLSLLTALALDTPLSTDCAKRNMVLPPLGVHPATVCPGPPSALPIPHTSSRDLAAQWTGAPIRAIMPLPRRTRILNGHHNAPVTSAHARPTALRRPRRRTRPAHLDSMDSEADNDGRDEAEEDQGSDEDGDCGVTSASRYFSYESITAAEGLSAYSFEELRVECYAQSLVARGTKPPLVAQPSLAIPPAFAPRVVSRNS